MQNEGMCWKIVDNRTDEVVRSVLCARGQSREFIMEEFAHDSNYRLEGGPIDGAVEKY